MKKSVLVLSLTLLGIGAECALAQTYPTRPVRLVVASSPGGASDMRGRGQPEAGGIREAHQGRDRAVGEGDRESGNQAPVVTRGGGVGAARE